MAAALLVIDVQNDFLPGGALAVPHGEEVIEPINELAASGRFDVVIATRDWHPPDHDSFVDQGGPWPAHCVQGTPGAELGEAIDTARIDAVVDTGVQSHEEGYSAFENERLAELLEERAVEAVTVVGLATDFCVRATALDAVRHGFDVTIRSDAIRGIDEQGSRAALDELASAGARVS